MSRKDYRLIANALFKARTESYDIQTIDFLVETFASEIYKSNEFFDDAKFRYACFYGEKK